jgi:phosphate:Na+ symporter
MPVSLDIWKVLTGVALFMLGMNFLEEGLKNLAGRPFKLFLKKQTAHKLRAVAGGTVVTGILQSSSVVNLMVLAFVGAGIIGMKNALAIILGANLGTTFSSWIIATIGFQFNLESFSLPLAGLSGILMLLSNKESRWYHWFKLFFGFSFLFVGLGYIKSGIENAVLHIDFSRLNRQPGIIFLLIGFAITSLIQSSTATMAIVLSALYANAIGFYAATALVLGSEIGTTIKLVLASIKGVAAKKRVALGNLLFNIINTFIIFIFLHPVNRFITDVIGMKENLIALVFFQTFVNLTGIIFFLPFLDLFGKFLEKRFVKTDKETLFIHKVKVTDAELALAALEKETQHFIYHVARFALDAFDKPIAVLNKLQLYRDFDDKRLMEKYEFIKQLHGDIHAYSIKLQNFTGDKIITGRIQQLISSSRNSMYAAKNLKDALPDIEQLKRSSNDEKFEFYLRTRERIAAFYQSAIALAATGHQAGYFEQLTLLYKSVQAEYSETLKNLYREGLVKNLSEVEFSTLLNFNREIYTLQKSVLFALKDFLLTEQEAESFDDLPGFIR